MLQTKRKLRGYLALGIAIAILLFFKTSSGTQYVAPALAQGFWTDANGNETWIAVNAEGESLRFAGAVIFSVTTDITWRDSHIDSDTIYDRDEANQLINTWKKQGLTLSPLARMPFQARDRFWARSKLTVITASIFAVVFALLVFSAYQLYAAYVGDSKSCLRCGYDLTGLRVKRCPECGAKRDRPA